MPREVDFCANDLGEARRIHFQNKDFAFKQSAPWGCHTTLMESRALFEWI